MFYNESSNFTIVNSGWVIDVLNCVFGCLYCFIVSADCKMCMCDRVNF